MLNQIKLFLSTIFYYGKVRVGPERRLSCDDKYIPNELSKQLMDD